MFRFILNDFLVVVVLLLVFVFVDRFLGIVGVLGEEFWRFVVVVLRSFEISLLMCRKCMFMFLGLMWVSFLWMSIECVMIFLSR